MRDKIVTIALRLIASSFYFEKLGPCREVGDHVDINSKHPQAHVLYYGTNAVQVSFVADLRLGQITYATLGDTCKSISVVQCFNPTFTSMKKIVLKVITKSRSMPEKYGTCSRGGLSTGTSLRYGSHRKAQWYRLISIWTIEDTRSCAPYSLAAFQGVWPTWSPFKGFVSMTKPVLCITNKYQLRPRTLFSTDRGIPRSGVLNARSAACMVLGRLIDLPATAGFLASCRAHQHTVTAPGPILPFQKRQMMFPSG